MSLTSETMQLQKRHVSVRKYEDKPIAPELLEQVIACGQAASTSSFVQAYALIRVTDMHLRNAISEAAGGQPWVRTAAEFFVICGDLRRISFACAKTDQGAIEGRYEHSLVAVIDAALMAQNMLLAAESVGLGGVFIGGIRNNPQVVIEGCQLPKYVLPLFGFCLGWPAKHNEVKPRMPVEMIVHQNQFQADQTQEQIEDYDQLLRKYYAERSSNQKDSQWSNETAHAIQGKKREHMTEVAREQGFFVC